MNNDGFLDVVEGNSGERNYVHPGRRYGTFMEIGLKEDTYDIEVGDLNHDGLPDLVESNSGEWNLYYFTRKK